MIYYKTEGPTESDLCHRVFKSLRHVLEAFENENDFPRKTVWDDCYNVTKIDAEDLCYLKDKATIIQGVKKQIEDGEV